MKLSFNKKAKQRIISLTTAFAILANSVPSGGLSDIVFPLFSLNAKAADNVLTDGSTQLNTVMLGEAPSYTPTTEGSEFINQNNNYVNYNSATNNYTITFNSMTLFLDYCWHYNHTEGFAATHKNDVLLISLTNDTSDTRGIIPDTFEGLGNSLTPFDGTVRFAGSTFTIKAHRAFFGAVTDSVQLLNDADGQQTELILVRLSDVPDGESLPLLADHVVHNGGTADWKITLSSESSKSYSGVIGEAAENTAVKLNYTNNSSAAIKSASDVGEICGIMQSGSSIELTYSATSAHGITSSGGNAGGLVGTMNGNASLTIKDMPDIALNATSTSAYAGGLVGELTSQATITNQIGSAIPVSGSITGGEGAGGLFGHYTNYATEFDLAGYNNTATVDGKYCGGVFGVLENNSTSLTVKNTGAGTLNVNSGTTGNASGYFGGIAGKYKTDALSDSLVLDGLTLTANAKAAYKAFGGAIGIVDPEAYVQTTDTMSVTASGTAKSEYFGGLVGATSDTNGVFVDLGNFTLNTGSEGFKGGGVVGLFNSGVLRLSGTTTMTNAKPASAANCGQLVGNNNNVLTYAKSGWSFNRSNGALTDDLGTWGEVVRVAESDIVTVDSTAHTVTLKAADTSMGTPAAFARTALNIQLNQGRDYDCLLFAKDSSNNVDTANTRDTLLASTTLSLSGDISLVGTGITGFMRDGGNVSTIGSFTGILDGKGHTITLAVGENYGTGASGQTEGMGQIYRHQHNGLFAVLAGTVKELTVTGTINVSNCVDGMNIGGIASRNSGNVTLTKVTANEIVNYNESSKVEVKGEGKNIGGYIGFVGSNGTITINGVSSIGATFNLKGSHESWNVYGGAIGKITAGTFTVNIGTKGDADNKLTNSLTTDITGVTAVGTNSDSGGLIGYITSGGSYGNRKVNLNNVEFSSCTVGNAASTNGGGFLGYAWLNTSTNVNGVTVTNGTINNSTAPNVGVMLYSSTGKMKVDSLSINGLAMSAGGETSLGMIVNKAYSLNDKNEVNGALYLDVLNAGYSLTGTTAPAQATGIFDEIAAYSAPDVQSGGAGVISINMNADRDTNNANFKTTGTYQNRLKTGNNCANPNARYYYNVDKMSSSDNGQNLVLWSLSKYARSDISSEFNSSLDKTLSGNADLTGLSFYPLASANDNYSIGDLTLTFDYSGIYTTENGTANTDSYIRDPATIDETVNSVTTKKNQHYLMHSGLFIDQPSGKSLTVTGKLSLGGTFMADDTHKGVLISGTENGNFTVNDNGSIELDGIKPMNGANAYKDGYLLINKIARESDLVDPPSLTVKNAYTTKKYSESSYTAGHTNDTVAKSLLGAASGKGLNIVFSHIKFDARSLINNAVKSDVALEALYNAYGTYNSIFTDSTLLASINTDQAATLVYNYTYAEDWGTGTPRYVTYGKEVSESVENADKQKKYYGDVRNFTNPRSNASEAYDFSTGFLKYVAAAYNATQNNGQFSRELKVNVMVEGLTEGCGTYNDPYIITSANQLVALSKLLQVSGANSDMGTLNLPKTASDYNSLTKNTKGARWCTDKSGTDFHAEYKAETNGTDYESTVNGASKWTLDNVKYYLANAYYVVNEDVALDNTFVGLGGKSANLAFRGVIIGGDVADEVEEGEEKTYHKAVITNNSDNPFINVSNGCVVKDINVTVGGSDISLKQDKNTYNEAYFGYDSQCRYYGGIIGEIMGGDNIIDNSYVTFASGKKVTLSGTNGTIVPVGGYVGVVVFGGLIFKNMDARKTTVSSTGLNVVYTGKTENLADNDKQEDWAAIYVNPIVGRVINGYAVNETGGNALNADGEKFHQFSVTEDGKYHDEGRNARSAATVQHTLKNGAKHYSIADIDPTLNSDDNNKLDVASVPVDTSNDGTINVPNAQAMFILSLITQSTSGTAQTADGNYMNSLSYGTNKINNADTVYGMSHNADYSAIGTSEADKTQVSDFNSLASEDTAENTAVPYIVDRYCSNHNARCVTSTIGYYDINLTGKTTYNVDSYTYQLPDSFRGIGCVGNYNDNFTTRVDQVNGNNCTIDVDIYLNKFATDNYFNKLHNGTSQSTSDNVVDYNVNHGTQNHGIGLFDSFLTKSSSVIKNITQSGSVNTEIYKDGYNTSAQKQNLPANDNARFLSVGGVCGTVLNPYCVNFDQITLNKFSVSGSSIVGGLLGFSGINQNSSAEIHITQCEAEDLSVKMTSSSASESTYKSRNAIGGFVGKSFEGKVKIYGTSLGAGNNDLNSFSTVEFDSFNFGDEDGDYRTAAGGLVGFAGDGCQAYDMKIVSSNSSTPIKIGANKIRFVGGICGLMQSAKDGTAAANQPYTPTCYAIFKNCTVENINLKGQFVGGFYGGKWGETGWTTYSIDIDNCKVKGNTVTNNTIETVKPYGSEGEYAGGFVGRGLVLENGSPNIRIKDSTVSNYTITGQYCGGFIGYAGSYKANSSITCYIHDSSVENCIIGTGTNYAGGAIGQIARKSTSSTNKILGYNIKLENVTSNSSNMGAWIGHVNTADTTTSIQFTGLAIYGNGFTKNVGNNVTLGNASFVFSAYDESKLAANPHVSQLNKETIVDMPKYPYVNINPQSSMGTDEIISGDGAVLYGKPISGYSGKTGDRTMAAKIYADLSDSSNTRRYTTFGDEVIFNDKNIDAYLKADPGVDGDRISTYKTEKGTMPEGMTDDEDFAVIVIANQTDEETTNLINRYIQLVTNTSTDYTEHSDYFDIDVKTCKYENGKFVIDESVTEHGLNITTNDKGKEFALNGEYADSNNANTNTFTLVDVQFKDPLTVGNVNDKIAYHLYVPVYTIKQMEVGFSVAVKTGASSVSYTDDTASTDYSSLMSATGTHIDSLETWVTHYIRFTYNAGDLNALLQRGKVDWNYDKYVNFATQSAGGDTEARLPNGTFMVLIDPNGNGDKEYYAYAQDFDTYNPNGKKGWIIDLEKFKQGTNNFEVQKLNAVIARYIEYTPNSGNKGLYKDVTALVEATPTTKYDVYRVDDSNNVHYYKYTAEGNGDSNLTISSNVNEDYYISMYVPKEENYHNELYYYSITGPTELMGLKNAKVNHNNSYNVLVADLYTQNTIKRMTVLPDDQQINASNKKIIVRVSTSITINNANARSHLSGVSLYHSFDLTLNRYTEAGVFNDIIGLGDSDDTTRIKATYSIGSAADKDSSSVIRKDLQTNYLNIETAEIMSDLIAASRNNQPFEIYSYVEMDFDINKLDAEFPEKSSENTIGVNVSATSNLAYDESRLAYTSMSVPFAADGHYYYRESVNSAKLDYTSVTELDEDDTIGKMSQNQSRLGINGYKPDCYQQEYMLINTEAKYNVSAISETDLAKAESLRLTISLSKKTDNSENGNVTGVEYSQISNLLNYLDKEVLITSGSKYGTGGSGVTHQIGANASSLVVDIPIDQCEVDDNIYSIGIALSAKTGENFHDYANYMVTLRTELIYTDDNDQVKAVENSGISDYVIYTNAKIFPTLIPKAS